MSNATSSTVSEVPALKEAVIEMCWTLDILNELNFLPEKSSRLCDSQPAIDQCQHRTQHRSKGQYENTLNFLRGTLEERNIKLEYISTDEILQTS